MFVFSSCFSCSLFLLLHTLGLTKLPLLGYSPVLLDNLPQILLAPQDALNSLVGWDPTLLVTMVTATHSSPGSIHHFSWVTPSPRPVVSSALKWKGGFRSFLLLFLALKISYGASSDWRQLSSWDWQRMIEWVALEGTSAVIKASVDEGRWVPTQSHTPSQLYVGKESFVLTWLFRVTDEQGAWLL